MTDAAARTLDAADHFARQLRAVDIALPGAARAGSALVGSALRIRTGGGGLYPAPERPATKSAEAVAAWLGALGAEAEAAPESFHRVDEMREALVAAAREVDSAVRDAGDDESLAALRRALYRDAARVASPRPWYRAPATPWVAAGLGGILVGLLLASLARR